MKKSFTVDVIALALLCGAFLMIGAMLSSCASTSELRDLRQYHRATEELLNNLSSKTTNMMLDYEYETDKGVEFLYWSDRCEKYLY